jgi:hypothetical protein
LATAASLAVASLAVVAAPAGAASSSLGTSATLTVDQPGVTVLKKGSPDFTKGKSHEKVKVGDTVQTDGTGLAELSYKDGSITRLDNNSIFTLEGLSDKTGARKIEGKVSAGQTWNRVQKLSGSDTFQQTGNGATAAVLGTAFLTKCSLPQGVAFKVVKTKKALKKLQKASTCQFTLVDGKLQLTSLGKAVGVARGQSVSVDNGGNAGAVVTLPPDILFTDAWVVKNLDEDAKAGIAEAQGTATADDLKQARIQGSWPVTLTVTSNNGFRDLGAGTTRSRTYSFNSSGGSVTLTQQTADGTQVIPLTYNDGVYSGTDPNLGTQDCLLDNNTVSVPNGLQSSGTVTINVVSAIPQNGLWQATGLGGTVTENADQVAGAPGQCKTGSATFSLSAAR